MAAGEYSVIDAECNSDGSLLVRVRFDGRPGAPLLRLLRLWCALALPFWISFPRVAGSEH